MIRPINSIKQQQRRRRPPNDTKSSWVYTVSSINQGVLLLLLVVVSSSSSLSPLFRIAERAVAAANHNFGVHGFFFLLFLPLVQPVDLQYPNQTLTRLSFGSCHKTKYAKPDLWPVIFGTTASSSSFSSNDTRPQVWLWTGDAIYPPLRGVAPVSVLEQEYRHIKDPQNRTIGYGAQIAVGGSPLLLSQADNATTTTTTTTTTTIHVLGSWDDHDYGANDFGKDMPDKRARAVAFWKFLGLPESMIQQQLLGLGQSSSSSSSLFSSSGNRNGTYFSVTYGTPPHQVKVILLDTRWHRDHHCIPSVATHIPYLGAGLACLTRWIAAGLLSHYCRHDAQSKTILGHEQWQWLEQELLLGRDNHQDTTSSSSASSSTTTQQQEEDPALFIVVSSIQVLTTNPVMESWGHFPHERQRLIRLLSQVQPSRVLVLSGDVHYGEIAHPLAQYHRTRRRQQQQQQQQQRDAKRQLQQQQQEEESPPDEPPIDWPFVEVTSSGLTHDCNKGWSGYLLCHVLLQFYHKHRWNSTAFYPARNFGRLAIDWGQDPPSVTVTVHNATSGQVVLSTGPLSLERRRRRRRQSKPINNNGDDDDWTDNEEWNYHVVECMDGHLMGLAVAVAIVLATTLVQAVRNRRNHTKHNTNE
ncbi:hypothetical protein ACA910_018662 [Epithemia clementina (nom. ined.)]